MLAEKICPGPLMNKKLEKVRKDNWRCKSEIVKIARSYQINHMLPDIEIVRCWKVADTIVMDSV